MLTEGLVALCLGILMVVFASNEQDKGNIGGSALLGFFGAGCIFIGIWWVAG